VKEMDPWKLRAEESASKFSQLEKARAVSEQLAGEQVQQVSLWRDKFQTLQRKYEALERAGAEEKAQRMRHEDRLKEIEQAQTQWMQDLEAVRREARQWEDRAFTLEKNAEEIRRTYEEQNRGLQDKLRNLESREKELETARRQLREANLQMEQREAAQKRVQLVAQLAEKETSLKRLVQDQQRMESEIREREEAMRRVLAEQEMIEKEIIEGKQAERYLLEKVKKESGPRHKSAKSETGYLRVPPDEEGPVSERA